MTWNPVAGRELTKLHTALLTDPELAKEMIGVEPGHPLLNQVVVEPPNEQLTSGAASHHEPRMVHNESVKLLVAGSRPVIVCSELHRVKLFGLRIGIGRGLGLGLRLLSVRPPDPELIFTAFSWDFLLLQLLLMLDFPPRDRSHVVKPDGAVVRAREKVLLLLVKFRAVAQFWREEFHTID